MKHTYRLTNRRRDGLTLVELLVVISIIGLLGGIIGLIAPRFAERSRVAQGSSQLRSWLLVAKQRAMRDKAPRGLRFVAATSTTSGSMPQFLYTTFAYVEQPEDITGMPAEIVPPPGVTFANPTAYKTQLDQRRRDFRIQAAARIQATIPTLLPNEQAPLAALKQQIDPAVPPAVYNPDGWRFILPLTGRNLQGVARRGDIVEFGGARYTLVIDPVGNYPTPSDSFLVLHRMRDEFRDFVPNGPNSMLAPLTAYRMTRLPKPIAGEPQLTLPKNIAVDIISTNMRTPPSSLYPQSIFTRSLPAPDVQDPPSTLAYEIIFGPSGEITGQLAGVGRVALWLRDTSLNDPGPGLLPDGENRLLVIHTRTGQVTAHAVCTEPVAGVTPAQTDFYRFMRDGKSSALEE